MVVLISTIEPEDHTRSCHLCRVPLVDTTLPTEPTALLTLLKGVPILEPAAECGIRCRSCWRSG